MQPVTINPSNVQEALRELMRASQVNDVVDISQNFSLSGTLTDTTTLNLSAPTAANVAAVLGTLLTIMQKGGINRTQ
jgi:hypothetical protein